MLCSEEENLSLAISTDTVDQLNANFYGRFPYPWRPMAFSSLEDPEFETRMLNQDIGVWQHDALKKDARIWIAGCGTNQALITALRFPGASILGSDLSTESLERCAKNAKQLNISNLELKEESINHVNYQNCFDYVICTGVIHHNYNPQEPLKKLAEALKPSGIMELMVYNRFHWLLPAIFQKAVRILGKNRQSVDSNSDLALAKLLAEKFPLSNSMSRFLSDYDHCSESEFADVLIQPVLHSYTVESLATLTASCGLDLVAPCINIFDASRNRYSWELEFDDAKLQGLYNSISDTDRWQLSNLLMVEESPILWFYLQRKDSPRQLKSPNRVCQEFLETKFVRNFTSQKVYIGSEDGTYKLSPEKIPFPPPCRGKIEDDVLASIDGRSSMREILTRLRMPLTFSRVNQLRAKLTTTAFPYLRAIVEAEVSIKPAFYDKSKLFRENKLSGVKSVRRKKVSISLDEVLEFGSLSHSETVPLVIRPKIDEMDLIDWVGNCSDLIQQKLLTSGAILFRGFKTEETTTFQEFAQTLCPDLFNDNGELPRMRLGKGIYTSVEYPADQRILWHSENTFWPRWPKKIMFGCMQPALQGGETPIVDNRKVFEQLDPKIRQRFVEKKITYVRNYGGGLGLSWETVFQSSERATVESYCEREGIEYQWGDGDHLRTRITRPAVARHPQTGETIWFNQATHWHPSCLDLEVRDTFRGSFREEELPRNCCYGDGSPIEDSIIHEVCEAYQQNEVNVSWERGDILLLDNMLIAHARNPYIGPRKILVAMGEMTTDSDLN